MKTRFPSLLAAVAALLVPTTTPTRACNTNSNGLTVTNVPALSGFSVEVMGLNPAGEMTGFADDLNTGARVGFLLEGTSLFDLGNLGGSSCIGNAINASGLVAGESTLAGNNQTHAFLYANGNLVDLGTLGGPSSSAAALNDAGVVAGSADLADGGSAAFSYANGVMTSLGTLGGTYGAAFALNNRGVVVGESALASGDVHAFVYSGGTMSDLGTLGGGTSSAYAINDAGVVAGESSVANGDTHGFVAVGGVLTDVGTLGGSYSSAFSVNSNGLVLGSSTTLNEQERHGFVFGGGQMTDLGTLGGKYNFPAAMNNLGEVVGTSVLADGTFHAFLWRGGVLADLNSLLPTGSGWELTSAQAINDAGRIVGGGTLNGIFQLFVLDPVRANNPPVAVASAPQSVECQAQVTLDGSGSSDPDGDTLSYEWTLAGSLLGTSATLTISLPPGTNVVTLKVSDPCGASSAATAVVRVGDTTPPTGSCPGPVTASAGANGLAAVPNFVPLVNATDNCTPREALVLVQDPVAGTLVGLGPHQVAITVTDASGNSARCNVLFTVVDTTPPAFISLPAPVQLSTDANCQGLVPNLLTQVVVTDNCTPSAQVALAQNPPAGTLLPHGTYAVTLTATDASGNSASSQVALVLADNVAPVIQALAASPNALNPPNHQLVPVTVSVLAFDNCDAAPASRITSITCDGPIDPGDIQITGALTASLAASKNPSGDTRVYTITVQTTDSAGNASSLAVTVTVPKSNGASGDAGGGLLGNAKRGNK